MPQNDINHRWFLLNDQHADYAATIADIQALTESHGRTYSNVDGAVADQRVVYGYMTAAELAASAPSLTIGTAAVLDRVDYTRCVNPNAAPASLSTRSTGDAIVLYGAFLQDPEPLPTSGYDRLVEHWILGNETVLYLKQTATGTGDGLSRANAKAIKDILRQLAGSATHSTASYTLIVFCGYLSRFKSEGNGAASGAGMWFSFRSGTAANRTQLIVDCQDGGAIMGGCKLGDGSSGGTFNEDAAWTDETGGMWSCVHTDHLTQDHLVVTSAGGTFRELTKVASSAACAALADSFFHSSLKTYVRLSDGSNPHQTTYFGTHNFNGVRAITVNTQFFDITGLGIYQQSWRGLEEHGYNSDFGIYGCRMGFVKWPMIQVSDVISNLETGQFSAPPHQPYNRILMGNDCRRCSDGYYDVCNGEYAPTNTLIRDNYMQDIGSNICGNNVANLDSHAFGGQSYVGLYVLNNRTHQCGWVTILYYMNGNIFSIPPGLENEPVFTQGIPLSKSITNHHGGGDWLHNTPGKNSEIAYNFITSPKTFADNASLSEEGYLITFAGDNRHIGVVDQTADNRLHDNRMEDCAGLLGAIRTKYKQDDYLAVKIYGNVGRNVNIFFECALSTALDGNNNTVDPSFSFTGNDSHSTQLHVNLQAVANPNFHTHFLDNNTYRDDDSAGWRKNPTTYTAAQFATYQGAAPSGDTYDPNSTANTSVPQSTDVATITINDTTPVVGQTLTATFADDDADGAGSDIRYEWRSNDRVVGGANSATYIVNPQDLGFALKAVAFYTSGDNRKVCVSAATSAVASGTYVRKAVSIAA